MKFGNEFWLILSQEYISPNLIAVCGAEKLREREKKTENT